MFAEGPPSLHQALSKACAVNGCRLHGTCTQHARASEQSNNFGQAVLWGQQDLTSCNRFLFFFGPTPSGPSKNGVSSSIHLSQPRSHTLHIGGGAYFWFTPWCLCASHNSFRVTHLRFRGGMFFLRARICRVLKLRRCGRQSREVARSPRRCPTSSRSQDIQFSSRGKYEKKELSSPKATNHHSHHG